MIAQKNRTGYTTPAPEKDGVGCGSLNSQGGQPPSARYFFVRMSPFMSGTCGASADAPGPCGRSANLQVLAHPFGRGWQVLKQNTRRHVMSNVSLCASAPVEFQFQSNIVRTVAIDGEVWFCATDVCSVLGYTNSRKVIADHCKASGVTKRYISSGGQNREVIFINEPSLYRLIIRSKKPEAEKFETWVMEEVLPAIRKTGAYIHAPAMRPALTTAQKRALKQKIWQMAPNWITQSGEQWIYNHLRVAFQVARFDDIPSDCFDAAMALLESKQKAISQYGELFYEMRTWFEREVLGASTPWTPHIRKLFFAKLGRQVILPPKVDWLALADEMKARKGGMK